MTMTREEWLRRYGARMKDCLGDGWSDEQIAALTGAVDYDEHSEEMPEDAADEELSCWTDDGDTP